MLSLHHSDKWGRLSALTDKEGRPVLQSLSARDPFAQASAAQRISDALDENLQYVENDVLHASIQGLAQMAFQKENAADAIGDLIAKVFERTAETENSGFISWKKSIVKTAFYTATEGEMPDEKMLATTFLEKLHKADPGNTQEIIENYIYPQEWDAATPLAEFVRSYKPKY